VKVFLVIDSFGAGGAERSTVELGKYLRSQSIGVYFIALRRKKIGVEQELEDEGFNVIYCPSKQFITRLIFLVKLVKQNQPDVVHSVLFASNLITRLCKVFASKPKYVQSLVNTPYSAERIKDKQLSRLKFGLVKYVDIISARLSGTYYHAITQEVLNHYTPLFRIKEKKCFVIYRGRYENTFKNKQTNQSPLRSPEGQVLNLINTGRHEFQKGQLLILQALQHLKTQKRIKHIHLTILGREGNRTAELKNFIEKNNLQDQVTLSGFRPDVEALLATADVFVFPSYFEGLGGALIEAFAAGLPCICSDLPVLKEVVGDEGGALFFEPGNHEGLALQIEKLYHSEELRKALSQHALKRFYEKFRIENISARMVEMYKTISAQ
jgi:glycosyltransferase involved in cell wall biosynthesis